MDYFKNLNTVKRLFLKSFQSSFHYAIATVNEDGTPHVTPIGSLILRKDGSAYYLEEYANRLRRNIEINPNVCVLAVNSSRFFWLRSLFAGKFTSPPAVRLSGVCGDRRLATEEERAKFYRRVRQAKFCKGHDILWGGMKYLREVKFHTIDPIELEGRPSS